MKKTVEVRHVVEVEANEAKFTPEFLREFREDFYDFPGLKDHIMHFAQLEARDLLNAPGFVEGYGDLSDFGVKARVVSGEMEILD